MNPYHALLRAAFRAMRHPNCAASLTTAFLVITSFFALPAHAAVTQLKIGTATVSGTADTSGSGWTWTAATETLVISNSTSITGGVNFVTDGTETLVTIISNGTVSITGGIGASSSADTYIQVNSNGPLTLTGGLNGMLTAVSGSATVSGGITYDLRVGDGASATITGGVKGDVSVAGGSATITGDVEGDFAILAGSATITGGVDGHADITSGTVKITGGVGDTAIVIGGNVTIDGGIGYVLGVLAGTVTVTGGIDGDLVVLSGTVTVTGTVGGSTHVSSGVVKVNGATVTPATFSDASIALNTLSLGTSGSGGGWEFDGETLLLDTPGYNYTLTGTAAAGINVYVGEDVTGTLTLQNTAINTSATAGSAIRIDTGGLVVSVKGNVTLAGSAEGIRYAGEVAPLILDTASGSKLTATGGPAHDGIYCSDAGLIIKGSGTLNFRGGDTADATAWTGIYTGYGVIVQGSAQVTATGGNYTGADSDDSGENDGIYCFALSITGSAKVTAIGGNSPGANCFAGSGVIAESGVFHVTSSASLTATAGSGGKQQFGYGAGIGASYFDCAITGSGQVKATGDYGIATLGNIWITGGNVTAQGKGSGYALYAARILYDATPRGGYVTISGGNVTAKNNDTAGHEHWKHLNHTGGTYNGATIGGNTGGNGGGGTGGNSSSGGGGGGGAPMPIVLVLLAAMVALRARRK